jgi:tRNA threonylcarbamoyladenosine biosynthesis protein TsaB
MRLLALDTTTRHASAALVDGDRTIGLWSSDPARAHAEQLPLGLIEMIDKADKAGELGGLNAVDVFAVAVGPGSFTGLRIGIATIQGLAFAGGKKIVPVSALDALASSAAGQAEGRGDVVVAAWMDAHRGEVFSGLYRCRAGVAWRPPTPIEDAAAADPHTVLARWKNNGHGPAICAGDGAVVYRDLLPAGIVVIPPAPLAEAVAWLALDRALAGQTIDPAAVQPLYVRRPDVEIARDARLAD